MRRIKRIGKKRLILFTLLGLVIIAALFSLTAGFIVLRHRQLCSYDQSITKGLLKSSDETNFCPNILDSSELKTVISNAFNLNILSKLNVRESDGTFTQAEENIECDSSEDLICWIKQMGSELKQTDGFTNMLVAVSDNRYHSGSLWGNTDSIMVLSLDNNSGKILLISFPRDIYTTYESRNGTVSSKINGIYALYDRPTFVSALETIIGKPIHYSTIVNFDVFDELIDKLGGIDITLEEPFHDLYPCSEVPVNSGYSCVGDFGWFDFPEGENHFNSFEATVYSRARYASSDYSRAKRQQNVVSAIINNALNKEMSLTERFAIYQELYETFTSKVETDIELKDLAGMLSLFEKINGDTASIVLDPNLDNGKLIYEYGISEVGWVTKFYDYTYKNIKEYIENIWDNLIFYTEEPKILIKKSSSTNLPESIQKLIDRDFIEIKINIDNQIDVSNIRVYDLSKEKKKGSVDEVVRTIPESLLFSSEVDNIKQSEYKEDILIILGN